MGYQKIINLLYDTTNQPSKFKTRNWDKLWITRNIYYNRDIKFKTLIIRSNLFDYSNPFIHVKASITVPNKAAAAEPANNTNKKVIFKIVLQLWQYYRD